VNLPSIMLAVLCAASPSLACAPVAGEGRYVRIETEEALIIWDAATKTEHLIRRAAFDTNARDFGFLVPTPTQPDLAEASDLVFSQLAAITGTKESVVKTVERKTVGGLDAAILPATDAAALDGWMKQNGYRSSPELVEWYKPYVANGWKITAFKIAGDAPRIDTAAVRMSFRTEHPFFPYREPASPGGEKSRLLRVYFLAESGVAGSIGAKGNWPATTRWSRNIEDKDRDRLLQLVALPYTTAPSAFWLTRLEDASSARPATDDLYFNYVKAEQPAAPAAPEASEQHAAWPWIAMALVLAAGLIACYWRLRKSHG
jgi:hypothetical protein